MSEQNITVRLVRPDDFPQLIGLIYGYFDFYKVPRPQPAALETLLNRLVDEPARGIQLLAEQGGQAVGFASLYAIFDTLVTGEVLVMNDLFVDPVARGAGAGEALFEACRAYAREHGFARLDWVTATDNEAARRLYDRLGGHIGPWVSYSIDTQD